MLTRVGVARNRVIVLMLAGLAACSSAVAPSPPGSLTGSDRATSPAPRAPEPYLFGHERLEGKVLMLGVVAARASVKVEGKCEEPVVVHTEARATGLLALLARSWITMDSVLWPGSRMPVSGTSEMDIAGTHRRYTVWYGPGHYRYEYLRAGRPPRHELVPLPGPVRAHDLHSIVIWMRSWRPSPGTQAELFVVLGRRLWQVEVTFQGSDVVVTQNGAEPCVRIDGRARKLATDPRERVERTFHVWFSEDRDRVPWKAVAESEFGQVELEVTEYACPGCGPLCRGDEDPGPDG